MAELTVYRNRQNNLGTVVIPGKGDLSGADIYAYVTNEGENRRIVPYTQQSDTGNSKFENRTVEIIFDQTVSANAETIPFPNGKLFLEVVTGGIRTPFLVNSLVGVINP